jgi:D-erythro-7,8-dihydroneopterin triphosphate epimerase
VENTKNVTNIKNYALSPLKVDFSDLKLRTYIGFNEEERTKKQDILINVGFEYDANMAIATDDVAFAVNYKKLTKQVIEHVESNRFLLLENLCASIIDIFMTDPSIEKCRVKVDKPHALRFAESVSSEIEASR